MREQAEARVHLLAQRAPARLLRAVQPQQWPAQSGRAREGVVVDTKEDAEGGLQEVKRAARPELRCEEVEPDHATSSDRAGLSAGIARLSAARAEAAGSIASRPYALRSSSVASEATLPLAWRLPLTATCPAAVVPLEQQLSGW